MNDDDAQSIAPELGGWGTPEPGPGFADRVAARVHPVAPVERLPAWRRWVVPVLVGTLVGAAATTLLLSGRWTAPRSQDTLSVLQAGPSAEVLAEPGSRVDWSVDARGRVRVDVVRGVVWVRVQPGDEGVVLHADGEETLPPDSCTRVSVLRTASDEDISVDALGCTAYEAVRAGH